MNIVKIVKMMALVVAGVLVGTSSTALVTHSKVSRYKKTTKCAQDNCEKALKIAENAINP